MKTPAGKNTNAPSRSLPELKKALRYLKDDCDKPETCLENCPYYLECNSVFYPRLHVPHEVIMDAFAYIQQLEAERDAAIADIKESDVLYECEHCAHRRMTQEEAEACERNDFECMKCVAECLCKSCRNGSNWEWRGVKEK